MISISILAMAWCLEKLQLVLDILLNTNTLSNWVLKSEKVLRPQSLGISALGQNPEKETGSQPCQECIQISQYQYYWRLHQAALSARPK